MTLPDFWPVSHFFQHLSTLISLKIIKSDVFDELWEKDDLEIIPKILIPIETRAIPEATGKKAISIDEMPKSLKYMRDFYENKMWEDGLELTM